VRWHVRFMPSLSLWALRIPARAGLARFSDLEPGGACLLAHNCTLTDLEGSRAGARARCLTLRVASTLRLAVTNNGARHRASVLGLTGSR
jgi:hypothetical protein